VFIERSRAEEIKAINTLDILKKITKIITEEKSDNKKVAILAFAASFNGIFFTNKSSNLPVEITDIIEIKLRVEENIPI